MGETNVQELKEQFYSQYVVSLKWAWLQEKDVYINSQYHLAP